MQMKAALTTVTVLLSELVLPEFANAGLIICIKVDVEHSFAVAYRNTEIWTSEGWPPPRGLTTAWPGVASVVFY